MGNLVWIDLEMTGLDPEKDMILEIAAIVTDANLNILAESNNFVISVPESILLNMQPYVLELHKKSGLYDACLKSDVSLDQAQLEILKLVDKFCIRSQSPLCGNSIWQDRRFLIKYMPELNNFLHYRNIDVSTIKELVKHWYNFKYEKNAPHRALDDIRESVKELTYYRKEFFKS